MNLETKDYKSFTLTNSSISFDDYHQANRCLPGDTVVWDSAQSKCQLERRADHRTLVGILELHSKYLYGHTSRGTKIYLFHPLNPAYPPLRVGCSERDTSQNQLALVRFESWTETIPRGNLVRLLGPVGTLKAEQEALLWLYAKPELTKLTVDFIQTPSRGVEITEGQTINIDPDGCKDIDDVITIIPRFEGWDILITIADVAQTIEENSPADFLASQRLQTVYQNGTAVLPMLPRQFSEEQLSLLPGQKRQGIALRCFWSNDGLEIKGFEEVQITNNKSYTYESIYKADFPIGILQDLASHLKGEETNDSHEWVEQLMLLYNLEGAKILLEMNGGLLRTHKPANKEMFEQMERLHPDLRLFAFESAKYEFTGENKVHATLGNQPYTHLTSPLRRYADLVNQRVLKAYLRKEKPASLPSSLPEALNKQQKMLKQYDRDLFFLSTILKETTGIVKGLVVASTNTKIKVYIPSWKRIIKVLCDPIPEGKEVEVEFFADIKKVSWKDRIVFRIKSES